MSRETTHICDGCDKRIVGGFPAPWKSLQITVNQEDGDDGTTIANLEFMTVDLCDGCCDRLLRTIDPRAWPRPDREAAE
jgi:hypothetical protein